MKTIFGFHFPKLMQVLSTVLHKYAYGFIDGRDQVIFFPPPQPSPWSKHPSKGRGVFRGRQRSDCRLTRDEVLRPAPLQNSYRILLK
jgi:hypothetical protein